MPAQQEQSLKFKPQYCLEKRKGRKKEKERSVFHSICFVLCFYWQSIYEIALYLHQYLVLSVFLISSILIGVKLISYYDFNLQSPAGS
jgi:hypothetical protein